jgi:hypothetical protein
VRVILKSSFAFGGTNSAVIVRRMESPGSGQTAGAVI